MRDKCLLHLRRSDMQSLHDKFVAELEKSGGGLSSHSLDRTLCTTICLEDTLDCGPLGQDTNGPSGCDGGPSRIASCSGTWTCRSPGGSDLLLPGRQVSEVIDLFQVESDRDDQVS